jgi:hypothetical protein
MSDKLAFGCSAISIGNYKAFIFTIETNSGITLPNCQDKSCSVFFLSDKISGVQYLEIH